LKKEFEKDDSALLLSAGDFYAKSGILAMYRGRFLADMMVKMGYCAVGIGENELNYQLRAIREGIEKGLPVICSNLYDNGECVFPPYLIKEVHGNRVGIFALLNEPLPHGLDLQLRSPTSRSKVVINELKEKKCDIIILIAHMGSDKLNEIMPFLDGVDIIIRGHAKLNTVVSESCMDKSIKVPDDLDIPVLFAGDMGRAIGKVVIEPRDSSGYVISNSTVIHLKKSSDKDQQFEKYLREYFEMEGKKLHEASMKKLVSHDKHGNLRERYLGVDICARCHSDIATKFISSPHSLAFDRLRNIGDKSECLKCHTTGYGMYSGFGSDEARKNKMNLEGVTCEVCHGYGTTHSRDGEYISTARNACKKCHNSARSPNFDYEKYLKLVRCYMTPDSLDYEGDCK
jgi:hypothetical protein